MKTLKKVGDIWDGDTVWTTNKGEREVWRNVTVLNATLPNEEILLNAKRNIYFITRMAISGDSWAQNVTFKPAPQEGEG